MQHASYLASHRVRMTITFGVLLVVVVVAIPYLTHHFSQPAIPASLLRPSVAPSEVATQPSVLGRIKHVFVIVEENKDWRTIQGNSAMPYLNNTLLRQGAYANRYFSVPERLAALHPSEPNYLLFEAGRIAFADHTFTSDDPPSTTNVTASTDHLVTQLVHKGLAWSSYQEDISGLVCPIFPVKKYAPKHNPFIFFQDVVGNPPSLSNLTCIAHNRPFGQLQTDLSHQTLPNYAFITPNLDHDMHDGSLSQADTWLSQVVPMITNSPDFKRDGALFITWDEGGDSNESNTPIGMIMLSPFIKPGYTNALSYSHLSLLKTVQEIFSVSPLLGRAANPDTLDLADFFHLP